MHCTAIFGGARLGHRADGSGIAEAGNSRLSGMYSTESPLAGADVPRWGRALCARARLGAVQRDSVPSDTPGLHKPGGTCCRAQTPE